MAKSAPWSERSGAQRRRTFGGFGILYAAIAVLSFALGWFVIGIIFAVGAIGLLVARSATDAASTGTESRPDRPRPDWMVAMDDPDAPDLSRPEYRTEPVADGDRARSPFDRPQGSDAPTGITRESESESDSDSEDFPSPAD